MAVSELNNSKTLAQKIVKPNTNYQTTMLWKYWNGLITKMSFIILQNLIFENCLKFWTLLALFSGFDFHMKDKQM